MTEDKKNLETILGYSFINPSILEKALTHSSYSHEIRHTTVEHNERLEFLGDQVLGLLVSEFLYKKYPDSEEGNLSHLRAHLVEAPSCASYALKLNLQDFIKLGKGEARNQGKGREGLMADLFEAIVGAVFLDGGFDAVYVFFEDKLVPLLDEHLKNPPLNYKAELQKICQKDHKVYPLYKVLEESGPEHSKLFTVGVYQLENLLGLGTGNSKKQAEMQAAKTALEAIINRGNHEQS
jgi:ribonuclease-3